MGKASPAHQALITAIRPRLNELRKLIDIGLSHFKEFDDYGFNRMAAVLASHSKFLKKSYDPEERLKKVNEALALGTNFYMSYLIKVDCLKALGRKNEIKETLDKGIEELTMRLRKLDIPADVLPENRIFLEKMKAARKNCK